MSTTPTSPVRKVKTWHEMRLDMSAAYGKWYTEGDLKAMDVKWRRIFAEAGFNTKGM